MGKKYIANGKLNHQLIGETGAPSRYGIQTAEQLISSFLD
jgi:hypothetical protein